MKKRLLTYVAVVMVLTAIGVFITSTYVDEGYEGAPSASPIVIATNEIEPISVPALEESEVFTEMDEIKVLSVKGQARTAVGNEENWALLKEGDVLEAQERIRTERGGRVTLELGVDSQLELRSRAELMVGDKANNERRFKLLRGRIEVDYNDKDVELKIENRDGTAVAKATKGVFSVLNTGTTVAVATQTGVVDLSAGGQNIAISAGQQASVQEGIPGNPKPISAEVMLRVVDPGCRVQRERFIVLRGVTSADSIVYANEVVVKTDTRGKFVARIPLKIGENTIVVVSESVSGKRKHARFGCITVDPGAPIHRVDIKWGNGSQERGK